MMILKHSFYSLNKQIKLIIRTIYWKKLVKQDFFYLTFCVCISTLTVVHEGGGGTWFGVVFPGSGGVWSCDPALGKMQN